MGKKGINQQIKNSRRAHKQLGREKKERSENPYFLIVCGAVNTEPSYFNGFRLDSLKVFGEGRDALSLVDYAKEKANGKEYDQIWCVFDRDEDSKFNEAIREAKKEEFRVAYSNQAFEYWIILHFEDHQGGPMHRDQYHDKINKLLKPYEVTYDGKKSKKISEALFEILDGKDEKTGKERSRLAIERAKRIYNQYDHTNPASAESSTTIFKLVEEILKYRNPQVKAI